MGKRKKIRKGEIDPIEAKVLGVEFLPEKKAGRKIKVFGVERGEIFSRKTLWKVKTLQGNELIYTGFEVAQMMSVAAKEKIMRGCKELEDGGYKFAFFKQVSQEKNK